MTDICEISGGAVADVLGQARNLYVAISTRSGPLVTPELYAVASGGLWCMTARETAKARLTSDGNLIGATAAIPGRSVTIVGVAALFDPLSPGSLLSKVGALPGAASGIASFTGRNAHELLGAVRDAAKGRLGRPLPSSRLIFSITPTGAAVLTGNVIGEAHGTWPSPATVSPPEGEPPLPNVPGVGDHGSVVVGWMAGDAPLALPAEWLPDERVAMVSSSLFRLTGAGASGPACLCFDSWSGTGPTGKQGVVVRGEGWAADRGDRVALSITTDRVTTWDGVSTATTAAGEG